MKKLQVDGKTYRLPEALEPFQQAMYIHLIDWKWKYITEEAGINRHNGQDIPYDAILPESTWKDFPVIYPVILSEFKHHQDCFPFKFHKYFYHMVSSQAANINLFLPLLLNHQANDVLKKLKPDLAEIATDKLDKGFQLEFWGASTGKGLLNDHNSHAGTDADIAIAYYSQDRELCLWLIEHKLTEKEFTECGGYKSRGKQPYHDCDSTFSEIIANPKLCYYHDKCGYKYWEITRENQTFFKNHFQFTSCPFRGGMNQLWRNQLLGLAVEQDKTLPYKHVYFSVVKHAGNTSLDKTISEYKNLIGNNPEFSVFTSADVVNKAAAELHDSELDKWIAWYKELYNL